MHYPTATAGLVALLSATAQASPSLRAARANNTPRQAMSQSQGFRLYYNTITPNNVVPRQEENVRFYLTSTQTVTGDYMATLTADKSSAPVFYESGPYKTGIITDVIGEGPRGIIAQFDNEFDGAYPKEHNVTINPGRGGWMQIYPGYLSGPIAPPHGDESAEYMVCERPLVLPAGVYNPGGPMNVVRLKYPEEPVPQECKIIKLLPECAELNDLPEGSTQPNGAPWNHDYVVTIECNPL